MVMISKFFAIALGVMLVASALLAQPRRLSTGSSKRLELAGGVRFASQGQSYELLPRAAAIRTASLGGRLRPGARTAGATASDLRAVGLQAVRVHQNRGSMIVYERDANGGLALTMVAGLLSYPVVRNVSTGQTGFLSGQIRVILNNGGDARAVARTAGLSLYASFPAIKTAFFQVPAGRDLTEAARALGNDSRIVAAEIEVLVELNQPL